MNHPLQLDSLSNRRYACILAYKCALFLSLCFSFVVDNIWKLETWVSCVKQYHGEHRSCMYLTSCRLQIELCYCHSMGDDK